MLQNKLLFNQSSVRLEIIGLPDYANDEDKNQISIISEWRLLIIDNPLIEGKLDHLKSVMHAFYTYSNFIINNENAVYESDLINIKAENYFSHNIVLKSSKPNVKPLTINIGNSVLADIVNCFDQLGTSNKVKNIYSKEYLVKKKKSYLSKFDKSKFSKFIFPPIISLCSIFLISTTLIQFYNSTDDVEKELIQNNKKN